MSGSGIDICIEANFGCPVRDLVSMLNEFKDNRFEVSTNRLDRVQVDYSLRELQIWLHPEYEEEVPDMLRIVSGYDFDVTEIDCFDWQWPKYGESNRAYELTRSEVRNYGLGWEEGWRLLKQRIGFPVPEEVEE